MAIRSRPIDGQYWSCVGVMGVGESQVEPVHIKPHWDPGKCTYHHHITLSIPTAWLYPIIYNSTWLQRPRWSADTCCVRTIVVAVLTAFVSFDYPFDRRTPTDILLPRIFTKTPPTLKCIHWRHTLTRYSTKSEMAECNNDVWLS